MNILFTRHSKRRMRLYDISENLVKDILHESQPDIPGKHVYIRTVPCYRYPLKVVVRKEQEDIYVITAYLLKREKK